MSRSQKTSKISLNNSQRNQQHQPWTEPKALTSLCQSGKILATVPPYFVFCGRIYISTLHATMHLWFGHATTCTLHVTTFFYSSCVVVFHCVTVCDACVYGKQFTREVRFVKPAGPLYMVPGHVSQRNLFRSASVRIGCPSAGDAPPARRLESSQT